ncbi:MAG: Rrf2 family transcriptional regulator [Candidatus Omnitrophica bacterium]|nr:Rrf2 family transcriptional regulator [Candidatus Omnitrophota bacterium]
MLSKTSKQLINALVELAKLSEEEWLDVGAIAFRTKASKSYLGKMLQSLATTGLVVSQKGFGGGFRLGKAAAEIALYDVIKSTENVNAWSWCAFDFKKCSDANPCNVHDEWKEVKNKYLSFLHQTTIADLMRV